MFDEILASKCLWRQQFTQWSFVSCEDSQVKRDDLLVCLSSACDPEFTLHTREAYNLAAWRWYRDFNNVASHWLLADTTCIQFPSCFRATLRSGNQRAIPVGIKNFQPSRRHAVMESIDDIWHAIGASHFCISACQTSCHNPFKILFYGSDLRSQIFKLIFPVEDLLDYHLDLERD